MKIESINCKIKNYIFDSVLLIILLTINIVLICNLRFILSNFFPFFLPFFGFFFVFIIVFVVFIFFFLFKNIFKIIPFLLLKRQYYVSGDNYVIDDMIISAGFLYYMDNHRFKRINIGDIKKINKRIYCSILIYRRFGTAPEKFKKERGLGPFRGKNEFGDINYCLKILDKNDNTIFVKIKTSYFWSILDTSFYELVFDILKINNNQIEIGDDELIKLHWNVKFRKQSDYNVKDYLIVNDKLYDKWVLDFDDNNKKRK